MVCPKCANAHTRVVDTVRSGPTVRRVRLCPLCRFSFSTKEEPELIIYEKEEYEEYEAYIATETIEEQKR